MAFLIYMLTCRTSGRSYIGVTTMTLERRIKFHDYCAQYPENDGPIQRAIRKHGIASFDAKVLYEASSRAEMFAVERGLIAQYGTFRPRGYNSTNGGEGVDAGPRSPEFCRKVSDGLKIAFSTPEGRAKQSVKMKGRKRNDDDKEKKRAANRSYAESPEGKADYARRAEKMRTWREANPEKVRAQALRAGIAGGAAVRGLPRVARGMKRKPNGESHGHL